MGCSQQAESRDAAFSVPWQSYQEVCYDNEGALAISSLYFIHSVQPEDPDFNGEER